MNKVFLILFFFLLIHSAFILWHGHNIISDDFCYFYAGKLLSEGTLPYSDFFIAHPPLQFMIYAAIIWVFGTGLWLVNTVPILSVLVSAYISYKMTGKLWVMVLFLTIFPIFHLSTIGFGLNLGLMFLMLSFYYFDKRPLLAGIFAGLVIFTRLHFLPIIVGMLFIQIKPQKKAKYILGGVVIALLFCVMLLIFPNAVNSIFFYHAAKSWSYWSAMRYFVLGIGIVGSFATFRTRYFIPFILYSAFMMSLKIVFCYYMIPAGALMVLALSEKDMKKWRYLLVVSIMIGLSLGATILSTKDVMENKQETKDIIDTVSKLEGEICGNNEITSLIALKTNRRIKGNEIDTNFQRKKILNCSNAITIHRLREFKECELIKKFKRYSVSWCLP